MSTFHHGISVTEQLSGQQAIRTKSPSVIGLIATADDADATYFPLDRPVLVTKISEAQGKAGTTGTLAKVLRDIADQARPVIVIVRVAEGAGATPEEKAADQLANTIGSKANDGTLTGCVLAGKNEIEKIREQVQNIE